MRSGIGPSGKLLWLWSTNIFDASLGRSGCSSPSTKDLHGLVLQLTHHDNLNCKCQSIKCLSAKRLTANSFGVTYRAQESSTLPSKRLLKMLLPKCFSPKNFIISVTPLFIYTKKFLLPQCYKSPERGFQLQPFLLQ